MANRTLVTFGTDGFRDWVTLPDGRTFNLGSVSVLNFVVGLARGQREARKALDTFLANQQATLAVRLADLQLLLAPKKSRWAGLEETLIPPETRMAMDDNAKALFQSRLAAVEGALYQLQVGTAKGAEEGPRVLETVRAMLAMVAPKPQEHVHTDNCRCRKTAASYDEDMLRELEVYLDNEMSLQMQRRTILKKLLKGGEYDVKEAAKAFEGWVEAGAKSYAREFNEDPKKFPKELVKDLAEKFARSHKKAVDAGEYDHLKSAADEPEQEPKEAPAEAKEAAIFANEGIAHTVLHKVEKAHEAVVASTSKYAADANHDLVRIASALTELLEGSDLSDPAVRPQLVELAKKAEHVLNFFVR